MYNFGLLPNLIDQLTQDNCTSQLFIYIASTQKNEYQRRITIKLSTNNIKIGSRKLR